MFRVCQMATCMFVSAHHLAKRACRAAFACNFLGVNLHDLHAAQQSRYTYTQCKSDDMLTQN